MVAYILISVISASVGIVISGLLYSSTKSEEAEIEQMFRKYDYLEQELIGNKVDAEIAYLEYLYGIDNYVRSRSDRN